MLSRDDADDIDYTAIADQYFDMNPGSVNLLNAHAIPSAPQFSALAAQAPMASWPTGGGEQLDGRFQNANWTDLNPTAPPFFMHEPGMSSMVMPVPQDVPSSFSNGTSLTANHLTPSTNFPSSSTNFTHPTFNFPPVHNPWNPVPLQSQPMTSGPYVPARGPSTSAGVMPIGVAEPGAPSFPTAQSSSPSVSGPSQALPRSSVAPGTTPASSSNRAVQGAMGTPPMAMNDSSSAPEVARPADRQALTLASATQHAAETSASQRREPLVEAVSAPSTSPTSTLPEAVSTSSPPPAFSAQHVQPGSNVPSGSDDSLASKGASTSGAVETASSATVPEVITDGNGDGRSRPKRERRAPPRRDESPVRPSKRKELPASAETGVMEKKKRGGAGSMKSQAAKTHK
ncbi:hypothetical protein EVJ58_g10262 [Rhodofomes roseus]|uniref:Uncharacterized protein n=1 Tax=Rhodofomes roseus TaxID=34475 RepID=A0A4Y9XPG6_9APHY|nr:hypothetical protein EVJ58_g10262 [Rhodofomes roseus]